MKNKLHYLMTMMAVCGMVGNSVGICMGTSGLFYNAISADLGISKGTVSMTYTVTAMAAAFSGLLIAGILRKERNLKPMILVSALLSIGGTFLMSTAGNVFMLYLFSIIRGAGAGLMSFVLATTVINQWFLAKNGLMISIAMAFSGLPGVLLAGLFTGVIDQQGWRTGFVFVAGIMVLFCLPAILYPIKLRPAAYDMKPYGYEEYIKYKEENPHQAVVAQSNETISHRMEEIILTVLMTIMVFIIAGFMQHLPSFAASMGMATTVGAMMTSFASAANITSKVIYGIASEKKGPFVTTIAYALMSTFALAVMLTVHQPLIMAVSAFVFGFTFANSSSAVSIIVRKVFGLENYTRIYPLVSFVGAAANALGVSLLGMLYDITGTYAVTLIVCMAMQVITILCTLRLASHAA